MSAALEAMDRQAVDETTATNITAQFYTTAAFVTATSDVPGYVNLLIADANMGFENSKIPITLSSHCIQNTTHTPTSGSSALTAALTWWAVGKL